MLRKILKVIKNLSITLIITALCIIGSAMLITYYKLGFETAIYLIQISTIIPTFTISLFLNTKKEVLLNDILYFGILFIIICISVNEFVFNYNLLMFVGIIFSASFLGFMTKVVLTKNSMNSKIL